jgi:hypothetical protein
MFEFFVQIAWAYLFATASRVFAKDNSPPAPEAATVGDINVPAINEGQTVPIFAGTVKMDGQNVSWFGGLGNTAITQSGVVTGYRYSLTVQLTFAFGPIDGVKEIRFDDNAVPVANYSISDGGDYFDLTIKAAELFGGDEKEGGVQGRMRLYKGTATQTRDIEVNTLIGTETPSYRQVCYAVARNFYWGTSPRLPAFAPVLQRWPNTLGLTANKHRIGDDDCNPVSFLHEIMVNEVWGAGEPTDRFDAAAWIAAAETVHGEGLGVSMRLATGDTVETLTSALLKYIDGTIYEDPVTGKYTLLLVRDSATSPPTFTSTEVAKVSVSRISWTEVRNTVKVTYTDRERNYETGGVQAQQSAALASIGNITDLETLDLPGFMSPAPAVTAATRALKSVSYPLSKVIVTGRPALGALRPGQAFRLVWTRPTINATYRVTKVDYGSLTDPTVVIEAMEDVFSTDSNSFTSPPSTGWDGSGFRALPATEMLVFERPYAWSRSDVPALTLAVKAPNSGHTTWRSVVDGTYSDTARSFSATGVTTAPIPQWSGATLSIAATIPLPSGYLDPNAAQFDAGLGLIRIDSELLAYRSTTINGDGTVTFVGCVRGSLDTVPAGHPSNAQVWLLTGGAPELLTAADGTAHALGALTSTLTDAQLPGDENSQGLTVASRALRPMAPGAVTLGGSLFATSWQATGAELPLSVAWATRSRLALGIVAQDEGDLGAESGTTYTVRTIDAVTGTVLDTQSGLTGTSATITAVPSTVAMLVEVEAVRAGRASHQPQRISLLVHLPALALESGDRLLLESGDRVTLE